MEGTAFYALAGAGASTAPTVGVLRSQLTQLIASMCRDESGVTSSMT